ncbi:MAG TPA: FmdB family zinc ribbon protein [Vicinamibacterales bacterium]|nr:FmdB family zinc ribbon protein [Vicinamibacterales bacterium]
MPIFEYQCKGCNTEFEALVLPTTDAPSCPACKGTELEKLISRPAIKSETTHGLAMRAAKKRDKIAGAEKAREQREYELHHND